MSMLAPPSFPARQNQELIPQGSPLALFISVDRGHMHGEPCFAGTRVPIQTFFDHLRAGDPIEAFIEGFPDVPRDQAIAVIDLAAMGQLQSVRNLLRSCCGREGIVRRPIMRTASDRFLFPLALIASAASLQAKSKIQRVETEHF